MTPNAERHDIFCGRRAELKALVESFEAIRTRTGPRRVHITGEAGRGKTRLALQLYEHLTKHHDPHGYWPPSRTVLTEPLRPAPDLDDPVINEHFDSFRNDERSLHFLWWGFRLAQPGGSVRCGLETYRRSLVLHLGRLEQERKRFAGQAELRRGAGEMVKELMGDGIEIALEAIPAVSPLRKTLSVLQRVWKGWQQRERLRHEEASFCASTVASDAARRGDDLLSQTIEALASVLTATAAHRAPVPTVVFCDDAHFARAVGGEGAQRLMETLWRRAVAEGWPLLLLTTEATGEDSAMETGSEQRDEHTVVLSLDAGPQPDLAPLIAAARPGLPRRDVNLLLAKADGCPETLKQLLRHIADAPAWITGGALTSAARGKIEALPSNLGTLIAERLKSAPLDVQQALAISAVQGPRFLRQLTLETAALIAGGPAEPALAQAESPHGLVQAVDVHSSAFVRSAHRDAARARLDAVLALSERDISALTWKAAAAFVDDPVRAGGAEPTLLRGMHGVVAALGAHSADKLVRRRVAASLLWLVRACEDPALAAAWAADFEAAVLGDDAQQRSTALHDHSLGDMHAAMEALAAWRGPGAAADLSRAVLDEARRRATIANTPDAAREVLRAASVAAHAHAHALRWASAVALFEDVVRQVRAEIDAPARASVQPQDTDLLREALFDLGECCIEAGPHWSARALAAIDELQLPPAALSVTEAADGSKASHDRLLVSAHERLASMHTRLALRGGPEVDADVHTERAFDHSCAALELSMRTEPAPRLLSAWAAHLPRFAEQARRLAQRGEWNALQALVDEERLRLTTLPGWVISRHGLRWAGVLLDLAESAVDLEANEAAAALCAAIEGLPQHADFARVPAARMRAIRRRLAPTREPQSDGELADVCANHADATAPEIEARLTELRARYRAMEEPDVELVDGFIDTLAAAARQCWSEGLWHRARTHLNDCAEVERALYAVIGTTAHDRFKAANHLLSQAEEMVLSAGETESSLNVVEAALQHAKATASERSQLFARASALAAQAGWGDQRRQWAEAALSCARNEASLGRMRGSEQRLMPLLGNSARLAERDRDWAVFEARHTELLELGLRTARALGERHWAVKSAAALLGRAVQRSDASEARRLAQLLLHLAAEHHRERPGYHSSPLVDRSMREAARHLATVDPALAGALDAARAIQEAEASAAAATER